MPLARMAPDAQNRHPIAVGLATNGDTGCPHDVRRGTARGSRRATPRALPGLADETIAAIASRCPTTRAMEGTFGQLVRLGVEVALNRFVDMVADPGADVTRARDTYVNLGRGEFHTGRSLDALLAATASARGSPGGASSSGHRG